MSVKQLSPPINVTTPFGPALAVLMQADEYDVWWCTFQHSTGECWWWPNWEIRLSGSLTADRGKGTPIYLSADRKKLLQVHATRHGITL